MSSLLRVTNLLNPGPLALTITLYMADGTPYSLPALDLQPRATSLVDIAQALASAPASVREHDSGYGSLQVSYSYPTGAHLMAEVDIRGLSTDGIDVPLIAGVTFPPPDQYRPDPDPSGAAVERLRNSELQRQQLQESLLHPAPRALHAFWSFPGRPATAWAAVSNTSGSPISLKYQILDGTGKSIRVSRSSLQPHAASLLDLTAQLGTRPADGGIRLDYDGPARALIVFGSVNDPISGAATAMRFDETEPRPPNAQEISNQFTLAVTGLIAGQPPVALALPADTRLSPYLKLRNRTANPMQVSLVEDVTNAAGATPQLPRSLLLPPGSTIEVSVASPEDSLLSASASFNGGADDLEMIAGSRSADGKVELPAQPQLLHPNLKIHLPRWSASDGSDTVFSLWNPADAPQSLTLTFRGAAGLEPYSIPLALSAHETRQVDLAALATSTQVDAHGNPFPAPGWGSVEIESALMPPPDARGIIRAPKGGLPLITVAVDADSVPGSPGGENGFSSVRLRSTKAGPLRPKLHADYENYGCGYVSAMVDLAGGWDPVGTADEAQLIATDCDGNMVDITYDATWWSTNTGTADVDSGTILTYNAGTTTIIADAIEWWQTEVDFANSNMGPLYWESEANGNSLAVYPTVQPAADIWWFGQNSSGVRHSQAGYNPENMLTTDSYGTTNWSLGLNGGNLTVSDPSQPSLTVDPNPSASGTGYPNPTCVYVTVNGVEGPQTCFDVREPRSAAMEPSPALAGSASEPGSTGGFVYVWAFDIFDNLGVHLKGNMDSNENWPCAPGATPSNCAGQVTYGGNYPGQNWGQPMPLNSGRDGADNAANGIIDDSNAMVTFPGSVPTAGFSAKCPGPSSQLVMSWEQEFLVGSGVTGEGVSVLFNMLSYFNDCAHH